LEEVMKNATIKNYITAIYELGGVKEFVKTSDVASVLGYNPASVTEAFRKMSDERLIEYVPYGGVKLTKKGKEFVEKIIVRRRILKRILVNLGVPCDLAEIECKRLELVITDRSIGYVQDFLKNKGIRTDE
jgi:DtxR family Mn-dependent transcriptional regulator